MAQVKGSCVNCHTMHNSQGNNSQVHIGAGAAWNPGTSMLEGGAPIDNAVPQTNLLDTDCVGCHSSQGNSVTTVTDASGNNVPIVYNLGGYPTATALAGGNFFSVASDSTRGHNVRGISPIDGALSYAPGGVGFTGCASSCHSSLTLSDAATTQPSVGYKFNGCKGCHTQVAHHKANDPSYRFLGGHGAPGVTFVEGGAIQPAGNNLYEDRDWEATKGPADHNFYKAQSNEFDFTSIQAFCAGCHTSFHALGAPSGMYLLDNGGDPNTDNSITANSTPSNPWLRHPTGVNIPNDGEYAAVFGQNYSPNVPVARLPASIGSATVVAGDQVMCLSCHRAHGSDQPDALRFDYTTVSAHSGAGNTTTGCFYCHRTKDLP